MSYASSDSIPPTVAIVEALQVLTGEDLDPVLQPLMSAERQRTGIPSRFPLKFLGRHSLHMAVRVTLWFLAEAVQKQREVCSRLPGQRSLAERHLL